MITASELQTLTKGSDHWKIYDSIRECSRCEQIKPASDFYKKSSRGIERYNGCCKECELLERKARKAARRASDPFYAVFGRTFRGANMQALWVVEWWDEAGKTWIPSMRIAYSREAAREYAAEMVSFPKTRVRKYVPAD